MGRTVHVVQQVVDAQFGAPCQFLAVSQVVGGRQSPQVVGLAVAVVLVVACGRSPSVEADAQSVVAAEAVLPGGIQTTLVVGRAVDGDAAHLSQLLVVDVAHGVEQTVVGPDAQRRCDVPFHAQVQSGGVGILQVLVLSHEGRLVLQYQVARGLRGRYGHEVDHLLHLIIIAGEADAHLARAVFAAEREVVAGLRLQAGVAQVEAHASHVAHIAVVLLLGRRRLESLCPRGSEDEVPQVVHRAHLGCQVQSKLLVVVQAQAGGDVEPFCGVPVVLSVQGLCPVGGSLLVNAQRCFQPVVAVVVAHAEPLVGGQWQHRLQLCHGASLVSLQGPVALEVDERVCRVFPLHYPSVFRGVVVVVGMTVPCDVGGEQHALWHLPLPAGSQGVVVVAEVVAVYVGKRIFAVRAIDVLMVEHALGIGLHALLQM